MASTEYLSPTLSPREAANLLHAHLGMHHGMPVRIEAGSTEGAWIVHAGKGEGTKVNIFWDGKFGSQMLAMGPGHSLCACDYGRPDVIVPGRLELVEGSNDA